MFCRRSALNAWLSNTLGILLILKKPEFKNFFFLEKSQFKNFQIWKFSKFSRSKKSIFFNRKFNENQNFQKSQKSKNRFSLDFHWKIFPIFRSRKFRKFSDLKIFELRFLQEKIIFNFRFFHDHKCLIICRLNHSHGKTNPKNFHFRISLTHFNEFLS